MIYSVTLPEKIREFDQNLFKTLFDGNSFVQNFAFATTLGGGLKALVYAVQMIAARSFLLSIFALIASYILPAIVGVTHVSMPLKFNPDSQKFDVDEVRTTSEVSGVLSLLSVFAQVADIALYAGSTSWQCTAMKCALSPAIMAVFNFSGI